VPPIDRADYDKLVAMEETMQIIDGNHPSGVMAITMLALKEARRELTPTIWIDDSTVGGQPTSHIKQVYPRCSDTCPTRGSWGATGIMPHGHVMVRYTNGGWLSHLREH